MLVIEPQVGECALFDPQPDEQLLHSVVDLVRLNHLSLSWILFTARNPEAFAAGRRLQQQLVTARLGIGALAERAGHNCTAAAGAWNAAPERLFEEEERLQVGNCFAGIQHITDGDTIRTGYVFEDFALFGCPPKAARLLKARPFSPCPLKKALPLDAMVV